MGTFEAFSVKSRSELFATFLFTGESNGSFFLAALEKIVNETDCKTGCLFVTKYRSLDLFMQNCCVDRCHSPFVGRCNGPVLAADTHFVMLF